MIPPGENADFVAHMEDVLDVYERPYDPKRPVVCMDEQPTQLIEETRTPISARPGRVKRYDYEYRRCGTANHFMFCQPLGNWRRVSVRERKTAVYWAEVQSPRGTWIAGNAIYFVGRWKGRRR